MTKKREKRSTVRKGILGELSGYAVFEIIWNIIMFIPRMVIRLITDIW